MSDEFPAFCIAIWESHTYFDTLFCSKAPTLLRYMVGDNIQVCLSSCNPMVDEPTFLLFSSSNSNLFFK